MKKTKWKTRLQCVYDQDHDNQLRKAYRIILAEPEWDTKKEGAKKDVRSSRHIRKSIQ